MTHRITIPILALNYHVVFHMGNFSSQDLVSFTDKNPAGDYLKELKLRLHRVG